VADQQDRPVRSLLASVRDAWQPVPTSAPVIDHELNELATSERITEVCRYHLLRLEYGVSCGGGLRAWLRLNVLVATVVLIPALLVVPVLTMLSGSFATLTAFLLQAAINLFLSVLTAIATVAAVLVFVSVMKVLWLGNRGRNRRRR